MPWESIGSCGFGNLRWEQDRILANLQMGIAFLTQVSHPIKAENAKLGIMWTEYETSEGISAYPHIGIWWNSEVMSSPPLNYVCACQNALSVFDSAVDWSAINFDEMRIRFNKESRFDESDEEDEDEDE